MTEAEQAVIAKLVEAWNEFVKLPVEHTDDTAEFRHTLHALQCQILARPTRRQLSAQPQPKAVTEEMVERAWFDAQTWPTPISRSMVRRALEAAMKEA